jgi:hypothetical protein
LPEVPYKQAVEALLRLYIPEGNRRLIEHLISRGSGIELPVPPSPRPIEACSRYHGRLLGEVVFHPVVAAVQTAFMGHRPLCLSPDVIWLMICQAVANHVNAHPEKLRHCFVGHEGKALIEVERNDFVKGSPENPWSEVIDEICGQVRRHVGPSIDLFLPAFSTTGPVERIAAEIVLLDAVQSYFNCVFRVMCGITAITLDGTTGDWESLALRAEEFAGLGLEGWLKVLRPILRQFVRASSGDVDVSFWQTLYDYAVECSGEVVTGWITCFFPYLKDRDTGRVTIPVEDLLDGRRVGAGRLTNRRSERRFVSGCMVESLPGGLSKAPFRWDYRDRSFDMEFLSGFVGVAQDQETLALRPEIGWAVREAATNG